VRRREIHIAHRRRGCLAACGAGAAGSENGAFGLSRPYLQSRPSAGTARGLRDLGYVEGQNLAIEYRFMLGQSKSYDELRQSLCAWLSTRSS